MHKHLCQVGSVLQHTEESQVTHRVHSNSKVQSVGTSLQMFLKAQRKYASNIRVEF